MTNKPVRSQRPPRVQAAIDELDKAANEYVEAKRVFEDARVRLDAAAERFNSVKRLTSGMLTWYDLNAWAQRHPQVQYAGMSLAEAAETYLRGVADDTAWRYATNIDDKFLPWRSLDSIITALEGGGFQFSSASPRREVNAALLNLATVQRNEDNNLYTVADVDEVLEFWKNAAEQERGDPDDLPF